MSKKILIAFLMVLVIGGFGFSKKVKADLIVPHAAELAKILKKNGMSQFDSKRVLYITRYFLKENPLLTTLDASIMALKRLGLASDEIIRDMATSLPDAEAVFLLISSRRTKGTPEKNMPKMEMQLFTLGDTRMKAHVDADNSIHVSPVHKDSNFLGVVGRPNERAHFGGQDDIPIYERLVNDLGFLLGLKIPF